MNFLIESESVDLEILRESKDKSWKFFMGKSHKVVLNSKEIIEFFMRGEIERDINNMYRYYNCAEWGEAAGGWRSRYMIVRVMEEYIFIPFRIISPMGRESYIILTYTPISNVADSRSVRDVIDVLRGYTCIRGVLSRNEKDESYDENNYYNLPERFLEMDKSSWRSKKGVNQLRDLIRVEYRSEEIFGVESYVKRLGEQWNKFKSTKVSGKVDLRLIEIAKRSDGVRVISFWYKDVMVGVVIGVVSFGNIISIEVAKTLSICSVEFLRDGLGIEEKDINKIQKLLGSFVQYHINKYAFDSGMRAVFYDGDMKNESLREFKTLYYKNEVKWVRENI